MVRIGVMAASVVDHEVEIFLEGANRTRWVFFLDFVLHYNEDFDVPFLWDTQGLT